MKTLQSNILPISMITGIVGYFIYSSIPALDFTHQAVSDVVDILQPLLLFLMLFLSFCRINFHELKPHRWQLRMLAVQLIGFVILALPLLYMTQCTEHPSLQLLFQSAMLCFICPTATAAVVVTNKLKGNLGYVISYTVIINIVAAIAFPAIISALNQHPATGSQLPTASFIDGFLKILQRTFPVLILPLVAAFLIKYIAPRLHQWLATKTDWAFYFWAVSLTLCMGITTHSAVSSNLSAISFVIVALTSLLCCAVQFWFGHHIGAKYGHDRVSGGQTLGQKNTALAIWLAYTFMNPATALAGGFYIIWQNSYNSYQLKKAL